MPRFPIDVPAAAYERLCDAAVRERRPVDMQAAVILIRALGFSLPGDNSDAPLIDHADDLTRSA